MKQLAQALADTFGATVGYTTATGARERAEPRMKINGMEVNGASYAYDGCHKIYICENKEEEAEAKATGYIVHPIKTLRSAYSSSCSLRFISNWALSRMYVEQFEDAVFS